VLLNRSWLADALQLVLTAQLSWLLAAMAAILISYFISSRVFGIVLQSLGRSMNGLQLWLTTVTAIVISQSVPAGGVGSYAFLLTAFKRRGVPVGEATLLALLEALSYATAMLLIGIFSVMYIAFASGAVQTISIGALITLVALGTGLLVFLRWLLWQPTSTMAHWLTKILALLPSKFRPQNPDQCAQTLASEFGESRRRVTARPQLLAVVLIIQLIALVGHSVALLFVLRSLGVDPSFGVALAAFGIALLISTLNVLPGGGGTVETILVATLLALSVGTAAVPAAILFRLLNFWLLLPVAAGGYFWQMRRST
jgi:uncharacterized protein (TIRG00374 family)